MEPWRYDLIGWHPYRPWLTLPGSLTQALQRRCAALRVDRLRQRLGQALADERVPLALRPRQLALIREVVLLCQAQPIVFAHSVIPHKGLDGPWHELARLGNRPLGEALFADPCIERQPMQYRRLDRRHPLYRRAIERVDARPPTLWARRSVFVRDGCPILVTEVFLPAVLELTEPPRYRAK